MLHFVVNFRILRAVGSHPFRSGNEPDLFSTLMLKVTFRMHRIAWDVPLDIYESLNSACTFYAFYPSVSSQNEGHTFICERHLRGLWNRYQRHGSPRQAQG